VGGERRGGADDQGVDALNLALEIFLAEVGRIADLEFGYFIQFVDGLGAQGFGNQDADHGRSSAGKAAPRRGRAGRPEAFVENTIVRLLKKHLPSICRAIA